MKNYLYASLAVVSWTAFLACGRLPRTHAFAFHTGTTTTRSTGGGDGGADLALLPQNDSPTMWRRTVRSTRAASCPNVHGVGISGWPTISPRRRRATSLFTSTQKDDVPDTILQANNNNNSTATSTTMDSAATADTDSSSCSAKPTKGQVVRISCRLQPEGDFVPEPLVDGIVLFDEEPAVDNLQFVLGWGNYLPGLHDLVADMVVGECRTDVPLDAGWGDRNPQLVATVSLAESGMDQVQVGTQLYLAPQNVPCVVTEVTDTTFTIDANPPLAGASYLATVTLKQVQDGPVVGPYTEKETDPSRYEVATLALGCFWGGELEFMRVPGVVGTAVGYTQGTVENPTYQQVCSGTTGHTEAIVVVYDPEKVSYETLVDVAMDRLGENKYLLNQVGNDKGTQYRHGIYYHTPAQKKIAQKVVDSFGADCVTECKPAKVFYFAEDYHQQYLLKGGQSARKGDTTVIRCYG